MIVVDASLAIKIVVHEADSQVARALWQSWNDAGETMIAPPLFRMETLSAVRRRAYRGLDEQADEEQAVQVLNGLGVEIHEPDGLYHVAWRIARQFDRPNVYDCCYLALAALSVCELWTADQRLGNAVSRTLPWVRVLSVT